VRFGLDFGTSNTSLAVSDGAAVRVLPIDVVAGQTMPTVLYIRRDGTPIVGRPAIDAYLEDNRSREPPTRAFQSLGIHLQSSNPDHPTVEAHIRLGVDPRLHDPVPLRWVGPLPVQLDQPVRAAQEPPGGAQRQPALGPGGGLRSVVDGRAAVGLDDAPAPA